MKRQRDPEPVSRHFSHILRRTAEDPQVALIFLRQLWPQIVGKPLAPKTAPLRLEKGVLQVAIPSAAWKQQLAPMKGMISRRINESWGLKLVEKIELKIHLSERGRKT